MNQTKFTKELIDRFGYKDLKPCRTPSELGIRLDKNGLAADPSAIEDFQRQIGSLMYLMTSTRPDLSYAVGLCARFMSNPGAEHFRALNRIWRYILHTINFNIVFGPCQDIRLEGYCDADWGGEYSTRRSTTGYLFLFGNSPISWASKLQKTVALSSCEAEYMSQKKAIKEHIWLSSLFEQLGLTYSKSPIWTDSQSAIALARNPEHHARTKHIDIQYPFC